MHGLLRQQSVMVLWIYLCEKLKSDPLFLLIVMSYVKPKKSPLKSGL